MKVYLKLFVPRQQIALPGLPGTHQEKLYLQAALYFFVAVGVLLRLYHYIDNRSLWNDEIYLATSLVSMDFWQLATEELAYQQKAPIGFLWMVKLSVLLFGQKEMALRLVPLLSGIAALFVFLPVVRHMLRPLGAVLAMALLCLSPVLVYHSVEIKQYGSEMLASVLCLYLYVHYHQRLDLRALLSWGLWGALILWFSYSSIFVLAGTSLALSLQYLLKKQWTPLFLSLIPFGLWLVSFALNFYLFTYQKTEAQWLVEWFRNRGGFLPHDPGTGDVLNWLSDSLHHFLEVTLGVLWNAYQFTAIENELLVFFLKMTPLILLFLLVGMVSMYKVDKQHFWVLILPLILTLLAAAIEKYPFYNRLVVFLAPLIILFLAKGCQRVTAFLPAVVGKGRYLLPIILIFWPLWRSFNQLIDPDKFGDGKKSYYREGLVYLKENLREGDLVYMYWNIAHVYDYYNPVYALGLQARKLPDLRKTSANAADYLQGLHAACAEARGKKRVWLVNDPYIDMQVGDFENEPAWYNDKEVKCSRILQNEFLRIGKKLDTHQAIDIRLNLYDLSTQK